MRLPLLSGADPRTFLKGARVRILAGEWLVGCDGVKDSTFSLTVHTPPDEEAQVHDVEDGITLLLTRPGTVYIDFKHRGRESCISVFLRKVA